MPNGLVLKLKIKTTKKHVNLNNIYSKFYQYGKAEKKHEIENFESMMNVNIIKKRAKGTL